METASITLTEDEAVMVKGALRELTHQWPMNSDSGREILAVIAKVSDVLDAFRLARAPTVTCEPGAFAVIRKDVPTMPVVHPPTRWP